MMIAVNISFCLSSGTFHAFAREPNILSLQYLDASAGRLYLLLRRPREGVRPDANGAPDLPVAEDLDEFYPLPDEPGGPQLVRSYRITGDALQLAQIDRRIHGRPGDGVPAPGLALQARQAPLQRHLAALVGGVGLRARAGAGALVAAPGGLAAPASRAASDALARLLRTGRTLEFVQPHYSSTSSTRTRWRTLWSMPRTWGVSACTLSSRMRLSPRARTVRLWPCLEPMTLLTCVTLSFAGLIALSSPPASARPGPSS